jgi:hypothetical protein
MTSKTRFFMLAATLVIVVGLCTGLVAYYGGLPTFASTRTAGPDELKYIPADAAIVAYANVRDVMGSQFRQSLRQVLPDQDKQGQNEFQEKTGIDIERDIDHVVACIEPGASDSDHNGFVLLRGNFDQTRLETLAKEHGAEVVPAQGVRLLRFPQQHGQWNGNSGDNGSTDKPMHRQHGDKSGAIGFVEPGLIVLGDEASIRRAFGAGAANISSNDELMGMIADVEGTSANLWAVGRMDAIARDPHLPPQIASQIPQVKTFSASSRIDGGLTGVLRAEARDDEAAKNLRDVVQGFLALAKMQTGTRPEFDGLLRSVQLSGTGKTVAISFEVPSEFIQAMSQKMNKVN